MKITIYYVEVSGRTYKVKEELKSLGLIWDSNRKLWKGTVSEKEYRKLNELADKFQIEIKTKKHELTKGYRHTNSTNSTWVRCWSCGRLVPAGQATRDVNGEWYCGC